MVLCFAGARTIKRRFLLPAGITVRVTVPLLLLLLSTIAASFFVSRLRGRCTHTHAHGEIASGAVNFYG